MPATLFDYAVAVGLMLVALVGTASIATSSSASAEQNVHLATAQLQAASLSGLASRTYAFDTSISGMGLAETVVNESAQPPQIATVISATALQRLASASYSEIKEDFDFRVRITDAGVTQFSYGPTPVAPLARIEKPVLYEAGGEIASGMFIVEVW